MAMGIPGKPPPLPRSITFTLSRGATKRESSICSLMFVVVFREIRLWVLFHPRSSSLNFISWSSCFFITTFCPYPDASFFKWTKRRDIAAGVTPGSLAALAMLCGLASSSFCFTSFESPVIFLKAIFAGMGVFSFLCNFSISLPCLFI